MDPEGMAHLYATQYHMKDNKDPNRTNKTGKQSESGGQHDPNDNNENPRGNNNDPAHATVGAHVETTNDDINDGHENGNNEDSPNGSAGIHVTHSSSQSTRGWRSVAQLLVTYPIDDPVWDEYEDD